PKTAQRGELYGEEPVQPDGAVGAHPGLGDALPDPLRLGDHPVLVGVGSRDDLAHVAGLRMMILAVADALPVAAGRVGAPAEHDRVGGPALNAGRDGP